MRTRRGRGERGRPRALGLLALVAASSLALVLVAAGGGGVPVVLDGGAYRGVEAVVDKDRTAALLARLVAASHRVRLARRFHNDAVAQALRVRRKPVVRWARLAGHASLPVMVEIDDSVPPGLAM